MNIKPFTRKQARSIKLARQHRITVYDGSVRASKTFNSMFAWLDFLVTVKPTGLLLIAGYSKETIKANILEQFAVLLGPKAVKWNDDFCWITIGDRTYKHAIVGASNKKAEGRIRGRNLSGALVDETTLIDSGFWSQLLARLSDPGAVLITATNPGPPTHPILTDYLNRARTVIDRNGVEHNRAVKVVEDEEGVRHWYDEDGNELLDLLRLIYVIDDNVALDREYVARIKAENRGVFFRRNILGEWCIAEGAIYDSFDPIVGGAHVLRDTDLPRYDNGTVALFNWCLGIDHGTGNPFHAVLIGFDRYGRAFACREWRYASRENSNKQLTNVEYATRLNDWIESGADGVFVEGAMSLRNVTMYVDPAASDFRTQLAALGFGYGAEVDKSVTAGIGDVHSLISANCYYTSEKCKHLIRERSSYSWDDKAQEAGIDQPIKVDDHGLDAERYVIRKTRVYWGKALIMANQGRLPAFIPASEKAAA